MEHEEGGSRYKEIAQVDRNRDTDSPHIMLGVWTPLGVKANWTSFYFPFPLVLSHSKRHLPAKLVLATAAVHPTELLGSRGPWQVSSSP